MKNIDDISHIPHETLNRIVEAVQRLSKNGNDDPTNKEVREEMGGGSMAHISPFMRKWRNDRKEKVSIALDIPANLKKEIEIAIAQVWTASNEIAQSEIESIKLETERAVNEAETDTAEALTEVAMLESAIAKHEAVATQTNELIASKDSEINTLKKEIESLNSNINSKDFQIQELKSQITKIEANHDKLQNELLDIAKARK